MTNAFHRLIKEHKKLKSDIKKLLKLSTDKLKPTKEIKHQRVELFSKISTLLKFHQETEEQIVYPSLDKKPKTHNLTREGAEEHYQIERILEELDELINTNYTEDDWTAKLQVFKEHLFHHLDEEEEDLFPDAKKVLSKHSLDTMQNQIEARQNLEK